MQSIFDLDEDSLNHLQLELRELANKHRYSTKFKNTINQILKELHQPKPVAVHYLKTLNALYIREGLFDSEQEQSELIPALNQFLKNKLCCLEEVEVDFESQTESFAQLVKTSLSRLFDKIFNEKKSYQSNETFNFQKKWGLKPSTSLQDCMRWRKFLEFVESDLNAENHSISKKVNYLLGIKAAPCYFDKNDGCYDQFGMLATAAAQAETQAEMRREELAVWTLANLVKAMLSYLEKYMVQLAFDDELKQIKLENKANEVKQYVLYPIIRHSLNPARAKFKYPEYQEAEIKTAIDHFDACVKKLKLAYLEMPKPTAALPSTPPIPAQASFSEPIEPIDKPQEQDQQNNKQNNFKNHYSILEKIFLSMTLFSFALGMSFLLLATASIDALVLFWSSICFGGTAYYAYETGSTKTNCQSEANTRTDLPLEISSSKNTAYMQKRFGAEKPLRFINDGCDHDDKNELEIVVVSDKAHEPIQDPEITPAAEPELTKFRLG